MAYKWSDGTTATSKKLQFSYTSSMMVTGTCPDKNYPGGNFQGTIHETRLYKSALSPEQVLQISKELQAKYS
jgi:hypothetical protein